MNEIIIKFGTDQMCRTVADGTTIRQVVQDQTVKATLGLSDNLRAIINDVPMPHTVVIPNGATLELETAANEKS